MSVASAWWDVAPVGAHPEMCMGGSVLGRPGRAVSPTLESAGAIASVLPSVPVAGGR
jgi:hypothetical protein